MVRTKAYNPPAEKLSEKEIVKEWNSIRSEVVKAVIENRNAVDNCNDDNSDDDDGHNIQSRNQHQQPKGYKKTSAGTFEARIWFKGKRRTIGTFKHERDAALAYKIAKRKVQALQQQFLPSSSSSSSSSSNNNSNNNRNRSREKQLIHDDANDGNNNDNDA